MQTSENTPKQMQISLRALLITMSAIAVVFAVITNPVTVGTPLAFVWLASTFAFLLLSIRGAAIANLQSRRWRSEFQHQMLLGLSPFLLPLVGCCGGAIPERLSWLESLLGMIVTLVVIANPVVFLVGDASSDRKVLNDNRLVWWLRASVIVNVVVPLVLVVLLFVLVFSSHGSRQHRTRPLPHKTRTSSFDGEPNSTQSYEVRYGSTLEMPEAAVLQMGRSGRKIR